MTFRRTAKSKKEEQESGRTGTLSNEDVPLTHRVRVLLSRDDEAHRRGYNVIATFLRNEGYEVILGGTQTPREIAMAAVSEDVDIIGYHIMTGAPEVLVPLILENMRALDIGDRPLILGGIVPLPLIPKLKALGVAEVFLPSSSLATIISGIRKLLKQEEKGI
jgi:methylmalonyl-CoA mutase, C-terminal domain